MTRKTGKCYVSTAPGKNRYFDSYTEAQRWVKEWKELHPKSKGTFHINPLDKSGFQSKVEGRVAFGKGCKAGI